MSSSSPSAVPAPQPRTAVFCVASALHYLAARRIAADFEGQSRTILIWYDEKLADVVRDEHWDHTLRMPWPRHYPLPGPFGRHRRLAQNVRNAVEQVGPCEQIILHSPVFDTEAINYLLHALQQQTTELRARILPDGLLNVQRYPLSRSRQLAQHFRRFRALVSPSLRYTPFAGDRIGSDAPFVDRIYVLDGFIHQYPPDKVVMLGPLTDKAASPKRAAAGSSALVVGQPLVEFDLMDEADRAQTSHELAQWLRANKIDQIWYKAHPREVRVFELREPQYQLLQIDQPLETHMAQTQYDVIAGCCSTALFTARQIYGGDARIAAFGLDKVRYKGAGKRDSTYDMMNLLQIEIH